MTDASVASVAAYLKSHPLPAAHGQGTVAPAFQPSIGGHTSPRPVLEFLLKRDNLWYVRWPNGSIRWESEAGLIGRGFAVPPRAIIDPIEIPDGH